MQTLVVSFLFFFQAEDGIRDLTVTWSSDVCSSDLERRFRRRAGARKRHRGRGYRSGRAGSGGRRASRHSGALRAADRGCARPGVALQRLEDLRSARVEVPSRGASIAGGQVLRDKGENQAMGWFSVAGPLDEA